MLNKNTNTIFHCCFMTFCKTVNKVLRLKILIAILVSPGYKHFFYEFFKVLDLFYLE